MYQKLYDGHIMDAYFGIDANSPYRILHCIMAVWISQWKHDQGPMTYYDYSRKAKDLGIKYVNEQTFESYMKQPS